MPTLVKRKMQRICEYLSRRRRKEAAPVHPPCLICDNTAAVPPNCALHPFCAACWCTRVRETGGTCGVCNYVEHQTNQGST